MKIPSYTKEFRRERSARVADGWDFIPPSDTEGLRIALAAWPGTHRERGKVPCATGDTDCPLWVRSPLEGISPRGVWRAASLLAGEGRYGMPTAESLALVLSGECVDLALAEQTRIERIEEGILDEDGDEPEG